jgi:hypothetical protein
MTNSDTLRRRLESAGALILTALFLALSLQSTGPGLLRFGLSILTLLFLPGYLLGRVFWHFRRWSFIHWFSLSTCLSLAMGSLLAWVLYLFGASAGLLLWIQGGAVIVLSILGLIGVGTNPIPPFHMRTPGQSRGRLWLVLTMLLAIAVSAVLLLSPVKIGYVEDALVHIATSKAVLESGQVIPPDQMLHGGEDPGEDPRVALLHAVVAALGQGSGVDMYTIWSWLRGFFALLWVASFFVFAAAILRDYRWSFLATVLFVLLYGGVNTWAHILRAVFYPSKIGMCVFWAGVALILDHLRWRDRSTFWLGALFLPASAMIHVTPFLNFWVTLAALAFFLVVLGREKRPEATQVGKALAVGTVLAAPYLLTRYMASYAIVNPIHLVPQRVLFLGGGWMLPLPTAVISWYGLIGLLAFPLGLLLVRKAREDEGLMLLFGNTVATLVLLAIPPVFTLAFRTINFLALRFTQVIPHITILTYFIVFTLSRIREGRWAAIRGVTFAALCVVLMIPVVRDHVDVHFKQSARPKAVRENPTELAPVFQAMNEMIPEPAIILSDPFTGYALLAFTHHRPMAVPVGHSSPRDSLSVARTHASSLALEPSTPLADALDIMKQYGVSYILLNHTFQRPHRDYGFALRPSRFEAQREYFDTHPDQFERIAAWPDVYLYRLRPQDEPDLREIERLRPDPDDCGDIPQLPTPVLFDGAFELVGVQVLADSVSRGEEMGIRWCWKRADSGGLDRDYGIYVRFDQEYDKGPLWREAYSKPYRKILERSRKVRYRFRADIPIARHAPLLLLPRAGVVFADSIDVPVPTDVAPGRYEVKITVNPELVHPNLHIRDFLSDRDVYDGVPVGWVEIR